MPQKEWTEDDDKAANEGDAIRRSFRSTRGKAYNRKDSRTPKPMSLKSLLKPAA